MIGKRRKNVHNFIHVFKGHGCFELNFNVSVSCVTQDMIEVNVMKSLLKKSNDKVNDELGESVDVMDGCLKII